MGVIETAVAWAGTMAADDSHGYDQTSRWGPDYDCSSLVISAFKKAGVPLTCTYTGNMKGDMLAHGFRDVTGQVNLATGAGLRRGDVLLHETKHTALYIGNGQVLHAAGNEYGRATGGKTGDQTGKEIGVTGYFNFPWECVLRYEGKDPSPSPQDGGRSDQGIAPYAEAYTVKQGDSLWGIAERVLGDGFLYEEIRRLNGLDGYTIYPGQVLKLPGSSALTPHQSPAATASTPLSVGCADISPRRGESSPPGEAGPPGTAAPTDAGEDKAEVTVRLKKAVLEKMERAAADRGITLAELIEGAFG